MPPRKAYRRACRADVNRAAAAMRDGSDYLSELPWRISPSYDSSPAQLSLIIFDKVIAARSKTGQVNIMAASCVAEPAIPRRAPNMVKKSAAAR